MTDNPNCSNCANERCPINENHKDNEGFVLVQDSPPTAIRREQVRLYGCLSHPNAREWLMRDVIKELELQANDLDQEDEHEYGKYCGFKDALSLIKGGKE